MSAKLLSHVVAFTAAVVTLMWVAPPAPAQPAEPPGPPVAMTLSLADVGSDSTLWFYGDTSSTTLSFPVPVGLRPETLNATVNLPFRMRFGAVSVTQDERLLGKVDLPAADLAPIAIPLNAVEVVAGSANVTLKLTALADDDFCLDQENPIGLSNASITYSGVEPTPTSVAAFLPSILRTLTVGVPDPPSEAESDAAVQLAAALRNRYRSQPLQIVLVPLPGEATTIGGPPQPMERRIVVKEGPDKGLSLSGGADAQLLISGQGDELTNQTRLLTDPSLNMAVSTKVVAEELHFGPALPGNSTTVAQLGQQTLSNVGVAPQVIINLDQTRFGHSTQGTRVHVTGSHTPVPAGIGAQMTASIADEVFDSWPAGAGGAIDHWIDIPDRLAQRYTDLVVGLDTAGNTGRCNEFRPITLTINGSSVVESTPASPPIPAGFLSLPQALMPRMRFGINENSFIDTVRAAQIAVGLQRMSVVPLATDVSSLQQAIDSTDPAVLISPDGWSNEKITLPVSERDQRLTLVGLTADDQESALALDPGIRFGSLQTVVDGQRSLLVATSTGAPAQLDGLLQWLNNDPRGWSRLRGNVVVAIEGREPQLVPERGLPNVYGPPVSAASATAQGPNINTNAMLGLGLAVIVAVAIGATAYWLGSRRRRKGASD